MRAVCIYIYIRASTQLCRQLCRGRMNWPRRHPGTRLLICSSNNLPQRSFFSKDFFERVCFVFLVSLYILSLATLSLFTLFLSNYSVVCRKSCSAPFFYDFPLLYSAGSDFGWRTTPPTRRQRRINVRVFFFSCSSFWCTAALAPLSFI